MVNNVQSSNGSKLQTGNGTDIDSQKPMQNSKDAYLSPNSQRRTCLAGHSGETVSKKNTKFLLNITETETIVRQIEV